jgi:hypothetical protein
VNVEQLTPSAPHFHFKGPPLSAPPVLGFQNFSPTFFRNHKKTAQTPSPANALFKGKNKNRKRKKGGSVSQISPVSVTDVMTSGTTSGKLASKSQSSLDKLAAGNTKKTPNEQFSALFPVDGRDRIRVGSSSSTPVTTIGSSGEAGHHKKRSAKDILFSKRSAFLEQRPSSLVIHLSDVEDYGDRNLYEAHAQTVNQGTPHFKQSQISQAPKFKSYTPPGLGQSKISAEDYENKLKEIAAMRERIALMEQKARTQKDNVSVTNSEQGSSNHTPLSNYKGEIIPSSTSSLLDPKTTVKNESVSAALDTMPQSQARVRATPVSLTARQQLRQKITDTETQLANIQKALLKDEETLENLECSLDSFNGKRDQHRERIEQLRAQILLEEGKLTALDDEEESVIQTIEGLRNATLTKSEDSVQLQIQLSKYREELFRGFGRKSLVPKETTAPLSEISTIPDTSTPSLKNIDVEATSIVSDTSPITLSDLQKDSISVEPDAQSELQSESLIDVDAEHDQLYTKSHVNINQSPRGSKQRTLSVVSADEAMEISSGSCPSLSGDENATELPSLEQARNIHKVKRKMYEQVDIFGSDDDIEQSDSGTITAQPPLSSKKKKRAIDHSVSLFEDRSAPASVKNNPASKELSDLMKRMEKVREEHSNAFAVLQERNQKAAEASKTEALKSHVPFLLNYLQSPPSDFVVKNGNAESSVAPSLTNPIRREESSQFITSTIEFYNHQGLVIRSDGDIFLPSDLLSNISKDYDMSQVVRDVKYFLEHDHQHRVNKVCIAREFSITCINFF